MQDKCTLTVDHCIITGGNAYAVNNNGNITTAEHVNTWDTAEDHVFAGAHDDTIHIDPIYSSTATTVAPAYTAKAKGCRDATDGSYMGWRHYIPEGLLGGHRRTPGRRR
jgi:hypothetical protein